MRWEKGRRLKKGECRIGAVKVHTRTANDMPFCVLRFLRCKALCINAVDREGDLLLFISVFGIQIPCNIGTDGNGFVSPGGEELFGKARIKDPMGARNQASVCKRTTQEGGKSGMRMDDVEIFFVQKFPKPKEKSWQICFFEVFKLDVPRLRKA